MLRKREYVHHFKRFNTTLFAQKKFVHSNKDFRAILKAIRIHKRYFSSIHANNLTINNTRARRSKMNRKIWNNPDMPVFGKE